jgi:hypothetical protein
MRHLKRDINTILKLLSFLLFFHTSLFATVSYVKEGVKVKNSYGSQLEHKQNGMKEQPSDEVSVDVFGNMSMVLMVVFSSLLGTFFVKDESDTMV